jgi:hypothetical protein
LLFQEILLHPRCVRLPGLYYLLFIWFLRNQEILLHRSPLAPSPAPPSWMLLAPSPDTRRALASAEVIPVLRLAQPLPLTQGLAGLAALRLAAIALAMAIARIRNVVSFAMLALAGSGAGHPQVSTADTQSIRGRSTTGEEKPPIYEVNIIWLCEE